MLRTVNCRLSLSMGREISALVLARQSMIIPRSSSDKCRASFELYKKNEYVFISLPSDVPFIKSG